MFSGMEEEQKKKYRTRQDVKEMIKKKDEMEKEIFDLQEQLKGSPKKLIDEEGYPIQGVDIHGLLFLKNRLACLKNDHEALMRDIEQAMQEVFLSERSEDQKKEAELAAMEDEKAAKQEEENYLKTHEPKAMDAGMAGIPITKGKSLEEEEAEEGLFEYPETIMQKYLAEHEQKVQMFEEKEKEEVSKGWKKARLDVEKLEEEEEEKKPKKEEEEETGELELEPFLQVEMVEHNSPAYAAGLMKGDKIIKFGKITKKHIETYSLTILADLVEKNLNKKIDVFVEREMPIEAEEGEEKKTKLILKKLPLFPSSWEGKGYLGCQMNIIY